MVNCSNCGFDVGDSAFCPNCGTKVEKEILNSVCPNCGQEVGGSAFCPSCGNKMSVEKQETSVSFNEQVSDHVNHNMHDNVGEEFSSKSVADKVLEVDSAFSQKLGSKMMKSKSVDKLFGRTANWKRHTSKKSGDETAKFYSKKEPAFLEIYELVDDEYLKSILLIEREKLGNVGGGAIGGAMSMVYVPTKDMNHDEARQFYIDIVNKIIDEINQLKNQGIFDEDEYYKQKVKESSLENLSMVGALKAFKTLRK